MVRVPLVGKRALSQGAAVLGLALLADDSGNPHTAVGLEDPLR